MHIEHFFNEQPYAIQIKSILMEKRALQINVIWVSIKKNMKNPQQKSEKKLVASNFFQQIFNN